MHNNFILTLKLYKHNIYVAKSKIIAQKCRADCKPCIDEETSYAVYDDIRVYIFFDAAVDHTCHTVYEYMRTVHSKLDSMHCVVLMYKFKHQ